MHCGKCGSKNLDTAKFCISCGTNLTEYKTPLPLDKLDVEGTIVGETPRSFIARSLGNLSTVSDEEKQRLIFRPNEVINNQYEVLGFVGAGGMGAVYRVKDLFTKEERALKVMLPSLVEDPKAIERFESEAKIAQKLVNDNIVRTYTIGEILKVGDSTGKAIGSRAVGIRFIVMEYVDGPSLRKWLIGQKEKGKKIAFEQAINVIIQICQGLEYAHKTTIHRDVKPENILLYTTS